MLQSIGRPSEPTSSKPAFLIVTAGEKVRLSIQTEPIDPLYKKKRKLPWVRVPLLNLPVKVCQTPLTCSGFTAPVDFQDVAWLFLTCSKSLFLT